MYRDVLLCLDLNDKHSWRNAIPAAVSLCDSYGAVLHALTVLPDLRLPMFSQALPADFEPRTMDALLGRLGELLAAQIHRGIDVRPIVAQGKIHRQILATAAAIPADLIIMAAAPPGRGVLGSNAERVLREAGCAVLLVRDR